MNDIEEKEIDIPSIEDATYTDLIHKKHNIFKTLKNDPSC